MLVELVGVLENGGERATGVPANPRRAVVVPRGGNVTLRVSVLLSDTGGSVVGGTLTMTLKKKASDASTLLSKSVALGSDFTLLPTDTKGLDPGIYAFDVWHTDGAGVRNPVVPLSPFHLEPAATLP